MMTQAQLNAYGMEKNQPMAMNDSQRQNKNQSQIQRNNFLITGNATAYQKSGINPSRDGKNNTDMRAGVGGGNGAAVGAAQGGNMMKWQQNQTIEMKVQDLDRHRNNMEQGLYTQINSPMYKQHNYPGMPKTTTNRQQASRGK